jgi:hypothetical protein
LTSAALALARARPVAINEPAATRSNFVMRSSLDETIFSRLNMDCAAHEKSLGAAPKCKARKDNL